MRPLILSLICLSVLMALAIALVRENDRLRAENEYLRQDRDDAYSAARQLWETINRAASEP